MYVGITRARKRLLITHTQRRYLYGSPIDQQPSRFLTEITSHHAPSYSFKPWGTWTLGQFADNWILQSGTLTSAPLFSKKNTSQTYSSVKKTKLKSRAKRVIHKIYGVGTVTHKECRGKNNYLLTIKFSSGIKKIMSSHVTEL